MKITRIIIDGFKGQQIDLEVTGRDIVCAPNMSGKTSIREALDFFATGGIQGLKREDLIDYAPGKQFEVTVHTDTGMVISRWFKVKKGNKTEIDLTFDPDGLEDNYTERCQRLETEFSGSPLVSFDLTKFLTGDDNHRLKTCMELVPTGTEEDVDAVMSTELVKTGNMLVSNVGTESEKAAIREVQDQLVNFRSMLPPDAVTRCDALAGLVKDRWAKDARAAVGKQEKAVRALGDLSREDGVSGVNVEALTEQLRQAQISLDKLQRAAGAAEERRRLISEFSDKIDTAKLKLTSIDGDIEAGVKVVKNQASDMHAADKLHADHLAAECERIAGVEETIAKREELLVDMRTDLAIEEDAFEVASESHRNMMGSVVAQRAMIAEKEAALKVAQAIDNNMCTVCASLLDDERRGFAIGNLERHIETMRNALSSMRSREKGMEREKIGADDRVRAIRSDINGFEDEIDAMKRDDIPVREYTGRTAEDIKRVMDNNISGVEKIRMQRDSLQENMFGWMSERGELANEIPEEMEIQAIDGAERQRDELQDRIEEAKRSRQRFEDQEKLRKGLDKAEKRLAALTAWGDALGLKGLAGRLMAEKFEPVVAPAAALVQSVLPDCEFVVGWETPRGNPGMRVFLKRGEAEIAYSTMSGAERAIVGTALVMAFAGVKRAPSILCLECEVMDDNTEKRFLDALHTLAGETSLLVMTHHGHDDLGIYKVRNM